MGFEEKLEVAEVLSQVKLSMRTSTQKMFFLKKLHNMGNVLQEKLLFRRTCPLAIFLEKKLNIHSEEVAQGQQIWPLQHPPTAAMEITEKNESRVISSKTQNGKLYSRQRYLTSLKKQSLNFRSKIYCLGVVLQFTVLCANLMTWMLKFF